MLIKNLRADLLKMKGLSIALAHLLIPIITSGVFLIYYAFSPWDADTKIVAFYQAVGAGFPVLIGIFMAVLMEQEQNAGNFQNLLAMPAKMMAFFSKLLILFLFSLFAVLLTTVIFEAGFYRISGNHTISIGNCLLAAFIMWCSSIPLYIWQMILAFQFGKGISIGAGIVSGLVCALMLTELGTFVWKYIPAAWTGRIPYCYFKLVSGETAVREEIKTVIPVYGIFTLVSMVYYFIWASCWEGNKISE